MLSEAKHLCISAVVLLFLTACSVVGQEPFHTCSTQVSEDTGTPTLFPHDGPLNWGLSTRPAPEGKPLVVLLWLENPTSQRQPVMTCDDIDRFWFFGFDVLGTGGTRVPRRSEKKLKAGKADGEAPFTRSSEKERKSKENEGLECFRNMRLFLEPYSCLTTTFEQHNHDFSRDLLEYYDLPAGEYKIVPEKQHDAAGLEVEVTPR